MKIVVLTHGRHQRPVIHRGSEHPRFRLGSTEAGLADPEYRGTPDPGKPDVNYPRFVEG